MEDRINNQDLPVYNIKAVSRLVGLLPVTLRAWERRYGLPVPQRGGQGYRLYSDYDLLTLRWIKTKLEGGLSISRAVEFLTELRTAGKDPALDAPHPRPLLILGGQAFRSMRLAENIPAIYLDASPTVMVATIEKLTQGTRSRE